LYTTEKPICRYCGADAKHVMTFNLPVPNKYLATREEARAAERRPHELVSCAACGSFSLANTPFTPDELFAGNYAFAPVSVSWRNHCVELARFVLERLPKNDPNNRGVVYDIGGNDGALSSALYRICARLSIVIDPSDVAPFQDGVHWPKRKGFFGESFARQLLRDGERLADAITATNVLAHVPDPLDFMRGVKTLLAPDGVAVFEFPDGGRFIGGVLFDTVYAEHIGYITLQGVCKLARRAGLAVANAFVSDVHGGSVRVEVRHEAETRFSFAHLEVRFDFAEVVALKLLRLADYVKGKTIIGFGSAAKSVVVNCCLADDSHAVPAFIIDETQMKIGRFQPGSGAKILPMPKPGAYFEGMQDEEKLAFEMLQNADVCINYAWNYPDEVREKLTCAGFKGEIITVHDF